MLNPHQQFIEFAFKMHLRKWTPKISNDAKPPFLLIHGLSSNAQTWDSVAHLLAEAGHEVVAIDQRNHGLSAKTDAGFDFETITADVARVLDYLEWESPILAGQSWGGNVLTEFGVSYPGRSIGLIMVDGGFLDFGETDENWETVRDRLKPPNIDRFPAETLRTLIQSSHQDWTEEGIDATMANFKIYEDGSIERHLHVEKHMQILHHLFNQKVQVLYPQIQEPVLICAAGPNEQPDSPKSEWLNNAMQIKNVTQTWFANTDHDIHLHKPQQLVETMFSWLGTISSEANDDYTARN